MSRLYYEKGASLADSSIQETENRGKDYLEKVAKLIPGEVVAVYLGLVGFVPSVKMNVPKPLLYGASFLFCMILTPFYLGFMSEPAKPRMTHLVVSSLAFVVWAYSVSGQLALPAYYDSAIAGMMTVAFTAISGFIPLNRSHEHKSN